MFFFIIFIVKNIKFINIDWENPNILSKILEITYIITYILFFICILISIKEIMYFQKKIIGAKELPEKVISLKKEKETSLIFFCNIYITISNYRYTNVKRLCCILYNINVNTYFVLEN